MVNDMIQDIVISPFLKEIIYFESIHPLIALRMKSNQIQQFLSSIDKELLFRTCLLLFDNEIFNILGKTSLHHMSELLESLPNNSVILCPGDSPSRLKTLLELLFGTSENTFELLSGQLRILYFVEFPISGLEPFELTLTYDSYGNPESTKPNPNYPLYRAYILSKVPKHEIDKLFLLDFHFYEKSFSIFRNVFPHIQKITFHNDTRNASFPGILQEAEKYQGRCISQYDSVNQVLHEIKDYTFCNLLTVHMYMLFQDIMLEEGEIPSSMSQKIKTIKLDRTFLTDFHIKWSYNQDVENCIAVVNVHIGGVDPKTLKGPVVLFEKTIQRGRGEHTTDMTKRVVAIPIKVFTQYKVVGKIYGLLWNHFSHMEGCTTFELVFLKSFQPYKMVQRSNKMNRSPL